MVVKTKDASVLIEQQHIAQDEMEQHVYLNTFSTGSLY